MYKIIYFLFVIDSIFSAENVSKSSFEQAWIENELGKIPKDPGNFLTILYFKLSENSSTLDVSNLEHLNKRIIEKDIKNKRFSILGNCSVNQYLTEPQCSFLNKCSSAHELVNTIGLPNSTTELTIDQFRALLPALLYQTVSKNCVKNEVDLLPEVTKPKPLEVWGFAILFVTLISVCSLIGVSVLPFMAKEFYQKMLTAMIGLAVGSLAASAVFHLIPQAYGIIGPSGHHEYLFLSLMILVGIWLFFTIERILKFIFIRQKRNSDKFKKSSAQTMIKDPPSNIYPELQMQNVTPETKNLNLSTHNYIDKEKNLKKDNDNNVDFESNGKLIKNADNHVALPTSDIQLIYSSQEQVIKASFGHEQRPKNDHQMENVKFKQGEDSVIATVAWMIIFGDGFHNFIDGVSIGAAFQQSIFTGISISLAVMCEELPHELGDFAVLINSGMTMKQALFYNFLSATTCYIGMVVGIVLGEFTEKSTYIFALAGGMFLYISLVDMVPEMNETATKAAEKSMKEALKVLLLQNIGMVIGVLALFFLAYYQDSIAFV